MYDTAAGKGRGNPEFPMISSGLFFFQKKRSMIHYGIMKYSIARKCRRDRRHDVPEQLPAAAVLPGCIAGVL